MPKYCGASPRTFAFLLINTCCTCGRAQMSITQSSFKTSYARVSQIPDEHVPEFAFIGRSNVGKSSLINLLTGRKELAKTSGKPGKTQLINYFRINDSWHLTDLPGYGYATQSKKTRAKWEARTNRYFLNRRQLITAFVLIDSNVPPQKIDLEFVNWLGENQIPVALVFTKTDRKKARGGEHVAAFKERLGEVWEELPPSFATSAVTGEGREAVLSYLASALQSIGWPYNPSLNPSA